MNDVVARFPNETLAENDIEESRERKDVCPERDKGTLVPVLSYRKSTSRSRALLSRRK